MTQIISISNHKGGVGKTTTSVNLGAALVKMKKRVLLCDLDAQCNLSQSLGIGNSDDNLYLFMKGKRKLSPHKIIPNLEVLAASVDMAALETEISNEPGREYILKELLMPEKDNFDFILIDCPPSLGLLTLNAYSASTKVIIPLQTEYLAMHGLSRIVEVVEKIRNRINSNLNLEGVVVTQYNNRKVLNKDIAKSVESHLGNKVFSTFIRENIALAEAPSAGMDIFRYNPNSNGADDYLKLAKELIHRIDNPSLFS